MHPAAAPVAPKAAAKGAAKTEAAKDMAAWAARFSEHARKKQKLSTMPQGISSSEGDTDTDDNAEGTELTEKVLAKVFEELDSSERLAQVTGKRVADRFIVKVRGCDANIASSGDRYDFARASFVGGEVERWCAEHFPTKTKDYSLKNAGEENAGRLAREWCRNMQLFLDLFAEHGSWEAAGGVRGFDHYQEEEWYSQWVDRLPAGSYSRGKALELRKLRPRGL